MSRNELKGGHTRKWADPRTEDSASDIDLHGSGGTLQYRPPHPPPHAQHPPKPPLLMDTAWRTVYWSKRNHMMDKLRRLQISTSEVKRLRILVHGPIGAGKSSFVNSIDSIFQEQMSTTALVATATEHSFTKKFETHYIKGKTYGSYLPFAICDVTGLEPGPSDGVQPEDLVNILHGCIKEHYVFKPRKPCSEYDPHYNSHPTLRDEIHCLVSVISANNISLMGNAVIKKMKEVRAKAGGIPHVVILTKVDEICPKVKEDIKLIYRSKKIREKMEECSDRLGIPMNCIFPVKNYSEEIDLIDEVDVLLLSALQRMVNLANEYVVQMAHTQSNMRSSRHGQYMDTEDRRMEHGHHGNLRRSRHGQYMDTEDRRMEHGHHGNLRSSRHGQYIVLDEEKMWGRDWSDA